MKILVTGGAGFIASHIVDAYVALGADVSVIDDLSTGNKNNLNPKAQFHQIDIRDAAAVKKVLESVRPNIVNHHAALAAVTASVKDPNATYSVNVEGTINLLNAAAGVNVEKFIFASTGGAMYGLDSLIPHKETAPAKPVSPYGESKLAAENEVVVRCKKSGMVFTIFRYSNVFGPRQNSHGEAGVMAIFSKLLAEGKQPTIFNKDATRDYVYVGDIAHLNVIALAKGENHLYNIGTGTQTSNQHMFDSVAKEYGYTGVPLFQPARPGEVFRVSLDASKAKKELGWQPNVSITEGLKLIHSAHVSKA